MRFHIEVQVRQATIPHQSYQRLEKPRGIPLDATEAARGPSTRRSKLWRCESNWTAGKDKSRGAATI